MLRIGRIDYANCTPIFRLLDERLPTGEVEIVHGVPVELNWLLRTGGIDICPCSSIEYARHAEHYQIVPGHCIGSDGPVRSVLLFSHCPIETLAGKTVFVTSESDTSVVLLSILLAKRFKMDGITLQRSSGSWQQVLADVPALLLIGDAALQAAQTSYAGYCYDLGELWRSWTGLPFVFALWLVNRRVLEQRENRLNSFVKQLDAVRDEMPGEYRRLAGVSKEADWMGVEQLADYWKVISYRLDERHLQGLSRFFDLAAELGLAPDKLQPSANMVRLD